MKIETSELILHRADESHLPFIVELFRESVQKLCHKDYQPDQIKVWLGAIQNKDRWKQAIHNQHFIWAEFESQMAGFGSLDSNLIDFMFVHPAFTRCGVASFIYKHLEEQAKLNDCRDLIAEVSITARPFFEKMGFKVQYEQNKKVQDVQILNYRMSKTL